MTPELRGDLGGKGLKVAIVAARFNEFITSRLLEGARAALFRHGVADRDVTVAWVPGSFEIPLIAGKMAASRRYDAVVCLGAVIRGETDHYRYIAGEVARGIAEAGLSSGVPVIFGVLTTNTVEQALDRAGGERGEYTEMPLEAGKAFNHADTASAPRGNSGFNAGIAAIEMANLFRIVDK